MFCMETGLPAMEAKIRLVWGHGWGQDHRAFALLVESLQAQAHHVLLDFPGFGQSAAPETPWGTLDYARAAADALDRRPFKGKTIWVGHSFGCRVGLQLAAHYPNTLDGLVLIAGAGLQRQRTLWQNIKLKSRIYGFKALKHVWLWLGKDVNQLRQRFGSRDYQTAGAMRDIFLKVVSEDLGPAARQIQCPTLLVCGADDTETPPEIGERLHKMIAQSKLVILEGQDHYSLLGDGRYQSLTHLQTFLKDVA